MAFSDAWLEEQVAQWRAYVSRGESAQGPRTAELERRLRDELAALVVVVFPPLFGHH
jgi:hypothetical protein